MYGLSGRKGPVLDVAGMYHSRQRGRLVAKGPSAETSLDPDGWGRQVGVRLPDFVFTSGRSGFPSSAEESHWRI